jgi:hypothetical protein
MSDCANVEMRELLPELAAGTLDASARARVERHVIACLGCASELETLRLVRGAFPAPAVDTQRIVAALPKPFTGAVAVPTADPVKRWVDWRLAAALTMITVGGLSVAVVQRRGADGTGVPIDSGATAPVIPSGGRAVDPAGAAGGLGARWDTAGEPASRGSTQAASPRAQLSFHGGVGELDDASIQALLGALDEIDRAPVAPSAEPDRSSVLPVIRDGDR